MRTIQSVCSQKTSRSQKRNHFGIRLQNKSRKPVTSLSGSGALKNSGASLALGCLLYLSLQKLAVGTLIVVLGDKITRHNQKRFRLEEHVCMDECVLNVGFGCPCMVRETAANAQENWCL